jgi:hypothetical protein
VSHLALLGDAHLALRGEMTRGARRALLVLLAAGPIYGAVMGTFGGLAGGRLLQVLYSALKVPLLLLVTFAVCVPSFFVLNTLFGARRDFARVIRILVTAQAALTVILASLAPYTALWYLSVARYELAVLFNGLAFAVASVASQLVLLRRMYRPLVAANPRHAVLLRVWLALYVFVGIQSAWVLRPFVGDPALPTRFFREEGWSNAYVAIYGMIVRLIGG